MGAMTPMDKLREMADYGGPRQTNGLPHVQLSSFMGEGAPLARAVHEAFELHQALRKEWDEALRGPEDALWELLQSDFINFYEQHAVNPYVPLAARGPWMVTSHGAVLHDSGGYGMLGFGHSPDAIIEALAKPWVIANVMTPSFSQKRFANALRAEIGHVRGSCPFEAFICMNSGSEAVTVAARISDILAAKNTAPMGPHEGRTPRFLALEGGFHGRTDRPAQASHSCMPKYREHLASFQERDNPTLVATGGGAGFGAALTGVGANGDYIEMMLAEPVMGEGNPGMAMTREFFDTARRLTREHHCLLLIDSIQAGLRASGCLSIVDYPGFEDCEAPDLETYSKALNGAQYPMSVLALGPRAAPLYERGVYGNTMTTNPRACEVGTASLALITPELRTNVRERGVEMVHKLNQLAAEYPGFITSVQGTGLLLCAELDPRFEVVGAEGVERFCRENGMGVIHGGINALRFTPHFHITSDEIDLVLDVLRRAIVHFLARVDHAA